ncbi:hypothetical protein WNY37_03715 [Henriciella sp. AS95]|uniref:hypothetical protein n=1 Tax=Henriciella sp. AS95 TaxID=3135782 RepID=UPI00316B5EA1
MTETHDIEEPLSADELLMHALKKSARGGHALTVLDIIDQKVSALFTFTSILVGATLLVASQPGPYHAVELGGLSLSQALFVYAGMACAILSAILSMTCLWVIDLFAICRRAIDVRSAIENVQKVTRSRMLRYRFSWALTLITLVLVTIAVTLSIVEYPS